MPTDKDKKRPTSFAEAGAKTKWAMEDAISAITKWSEKEQDRLQTSADALAQETEDKGLWGNILTVGTTLGCYFFSPLKGSLGECAAVGAAVGGVTRYAVDAFGDAEETIPTGVAPLETKYYAAKIPEITEDLNEGAETLRDYNANEWKQDILLQLNDSMTALKMTHQMEALGLGKDLPVPEIVDTTSIIDIEDPLYNLEDILGFDMNWQENLPSV